LNLLVADGNSQGPWRPLTWKQGIFSECIPRRFDRVKKVWMAICGIVLWQLWLERNDVVFNNLRWSKEKMVQRIWLGLADYGRKEWAKNSNEDGKFEALWCRNHILAVMVQNRPKWRPVGPIDGFDIH
jgi:hypothetical protein